MSHADILVSATGRILVIEVSRRAKRNALTGEMYLLLIRELARARDNSGISVVLLRGQDDLFTIGDDFDDFMERRAVYLDARAHFLRILASFEKPLIAVVAGDVKGIGATLLLHCDLVYAADNARFEFPSVNLGLGPEGGCSKLLPGNAGHRLASELLLLGEPFGPEKAREAGIVNAVFAPHEVMEAAMAIAGKLADQPQQAVAITKNLLKQSEEHDVLEAMSLEAFYSAELAATSLAGERIAAARSKPASDPGKAYC